MSDPGRAITEATPRSAAALFHYAPTALLFGAWDSTGPRGGRGSKFERAITSEVVGFGATRGVKTSSRLDPLAIERGAGPLFVSADGSGWTLEEGEAKVEKGKPVLFKRSGDGPAGNPSHANHGNIAPSIDTRSGGVTVESAMQTVVLSFVALRKLGFPVGTDGAVFDAQQRRSAETAARTALAALGLAAAVLAYEAGYDFRSRCVLAPTSPQTFELLRRGVVDPITFTLNRDEALALVGAAAAASAAAGVRWMAEELQLQPAPRLLALVQKSKSLSFTQPDTEG